jgi:acyl transferase domain-containing protein
VQALIQKRDYRNLAVLWVKGVTVDWEILYGNAKHGRISLPTYPFARDRYWIHFENDKANGQDKSHHTIGSNGENGRPFSGNGPKEWLMLQWKNLLGLSRVEEDEDFFSSGGNSLLLTRLMVAIKDEFSLDIPIGLLYNLTTVTALANYIEISLHTVSESTEGYEEVSL